MITSIIKRDGRVVIYDRNKIKMAILKAMEACGNTDFDKAYFITSSVEDYFSGIKLKSTPTVEEIQDSVETVLIKTGYADVAKA